MKKLLAGISLVALLMTSVSYADTDKKIQDINSMVKQKEAIELNAYKKDDGAKMPQKLKEDTNASKLEETKGKGQNKIFDNVANQGYIVALEAQSKEELQSLYDKGFRLFEISVSSTSDYQVVLAKNFDFYFAQYYGNPITRPSIEQYFSYKMTSGQSQMSIGDINQFIDKYPDVIFFVTSEDQEIDNFALLNNLSIKNKDRILPEVDKVLTPYKSFDNVAIKDLKGKNNIYSYVVNNKDKDVVLVYKDYLPTEKEKIEMNKKGVRVYFSKKVTDSMSPTGQFYTVDEAMDLALDTPKPVENIIYKRPQIKNDRYIAHAGGAISGIIGTNSLQALTENYKKGVRLFELDFDWTADGQLVALHDWGMFGRLSQRGIGNLYMNYEEFKGQNLIYGLKQISIDDVINFLKEHKEAYIVTDVKDDTKNGGNIESLKFIAQKAGQLQNRFIPQIYSTEQYQGVKNLGYKNIIFTLYRSNMSNHNVMEFVKRNDLYAVTMDNLYRVDTGLPELLTAMGQRVYLHTENEELKTYGYFSSNKAYGIYSDYILNDEILNQKLAVNPNYQRILAQKAQEVADKQSQGTAAQQGATSNPPANIPSANIF